MKALNTEIIIVAQPETIWKILTSTDDYPTWNPFIKNLKGRLEEGAQIAVTIHPPDQKPMTFKPTILKCKEHSELRWLGHLFFRGVFDGEHTFKLERINDTHTKFIHSEKFTGLFSSLLFSLIGKNTRRGFEAMNEALKERAENHIEIPAT